MTLPKSTAFFNGKNDAMRRNVPAPQAPELSADYESHMYYRGFHQQLRKMQKNKPAQPGRLAIAS